MDIRTIRIPYNGREKYPSRNDGGKSVANKVVSNYFGGGGTGMGSVPISSGDHDEGGVTGQENRGTNARSFNVWLTKTSGIFNYAELQQLENTDQTVVRAFKDMSNAQVWVGNAIESSADTANYDITGLPDSGMSITVQDNGTTAATIVITVDQSISQDTGELHIPVCININDNPIDPYKAMWNIYTERIILQELTYSWTINRSEGTPGATIRGPYDYATYSGTTRWWCDGTLNSGYSESDKWIDVIVKDGTYYYCNSTYYGTLAPWEDVEDNWTEGESFDFVATNLLLASGAAINFLTNNELYLRDSNNVVTAGARGGDNVNYWAGAANPSGAPYRVYNDGTLVANKGTFGPMTIGLIGEQGHQYSMLEASGPTWDLELPGYSATTILNQGGFYTEFKGPNDVEPECSISITTDPSAGLGDYNTGIQVIKKNGKDNDLIYTNGVVRASDFKSHINYGTNDIDTHSVMSVFGPMTIVYVVSEVSLFCETAIYNSQSDYGEIHWFFNGHDTGVSSDSYPYLKEVTISNSRIPEEMMGYYIFDSKASGAEGEFQNFKFTGVASHDAARENDKIYAVLS